MSFVSQALSSPKFATAVATGEIAIKFKIMFVQSSPRAESENMLTEIQSTVRLF